MADDIICLSSDDDFQEKKPKKKPTEVKKSAEVKKDDKLKKRKASTELDTSKPKKRIQPRQIEKSQTNLNNDGIEMMEVVAETVSEKKSSNQTISHKKSTSNDLDRPSTSKAGSASETMKNGPKLEIKEKRLVDCTQDGSAIFAHFLSQCLMKDRSSDMKKIVERLKRHYEQTDPAYKHSSAFINLLNEKRDSLMKDGKIYIHIGDIDKEMKCRRRNTTTSSEKQEEEEEKEKEEIDVEEITVDEATAELRKKNYNRIRKIEKAMEKCREKIKEFGDAEVDWDDDENSNYIKLTRYEEKMTQLYYMLCNLTGDNADAGRRYLRPKCLKVTKIEQVDQAIISFMTQKLKNKRKKTQKGLSTANCTIFPDYCDILKCIKKCNEDEKLQMNKSSMEKLAQKAFRELGNYLQKIRREDLLDGLSLMLENEEDPAQQHPELLRKLEESKLRGRKKLDGVFDEYAKRQEEGSTKTNDTDSDAGQNKNNDDGDEDDEDDEDDDDEDEEEEDDEKNLPDEDDSDIDIDVISQQGSEDTLVIEKGEESPIDPLAIEQDPSREDRVTPMEINDMSDSAETVIISPSKNIQNPQVILSNKLFIQPYKIVSDVEGTVTIDDKHVQHEKSNSDLQLSKIPRPGPKSSKISLKPSITNIERVRVVIKANEIVRIDGKAETLAQSIGAPKKNFEVAEGAKSGTDTSKTLEGVGGIKVNSKIPQETQESKTITKETSLSKAASFENQEITSSTEDIIEKTESPEITVVEDEDEPKENTALTENDSALPDSTLKVADVEETDNTKVSNQTENEVRPVLKLRSFAKTPDFWNNSPEKQTQIIKSTKTMVTPNTIEVVELENVTVGKNKSPVRRNVTVRKPLTIPGTSSASSVSQILLTPVDITRKPLVNRSTSSQPTIIRLVEPAKSTKTRVIGSPLQTKILPMISAKSASSSSLSQNSHVARSLIRPIQNTTVGSSSVLHKPNKTVCINPVNRQALATHSPDRLVNPVSVLKIMKKRQ